MLIRYGYDFTITCAQDTPLVCLVSARPGHEVDMVGPEQHRTWPDVAVTTHVDLFGNRARRLVAPRGGLRLSGTGTMRADGLPDPVAGHACEHPVQELPPEVLPFLHGSRYCETDLVSQFAWDMFGRMEPGWGRVQAVVDWVHGHIRFDYARARATRTAHDALRERVGVCRDYAHLAITLLRALNVPARYVNGHLGDIGVPFNPEPMDYAAWIEVWLGGAWHTFDPRNNARRIGRIVVARGRDAADVPMIQSFGAHVLTDFRVITEEEKVAAA